MSGNSFLIDTNIALALLGGNQDLSDILQGSQIHVSFITQLEILGYKGITPKDQQAARNFLNDCFIVDINDEIKKYTIQIRQKHSLKLPDSIIAATSVFLDIPLLTADKDFRKVTGLNLLLYQN